MTRFYSLASSSSGNCSVFQGGGRTLLIDGGTNTKYIRNALSQLGIALGDITDVLHTHSDHVSALPVLTKHCRAPIHATVPTVEGLKEKCAHDQLEVVEPDAPFWLGEVRITPFLTPHDCPGSCGFLLEREKWAIAPIWGICRTLCLKPCGEWRRCFWNPTTMCIS